jgi:hypothetical protein
MSKYMNDESFSINIDPRSHLEVFDKKHRYGKNLRAYFKHYMTNVNQSAGFAADSHLNPNMVDKVELFTQFFSWLDDASNAGDVSVLHSGDKTDVFNASLC